MGGGAVRLRLGIVPLSEGFLVFRARKGAERARDYHF